VFLAIIHSDGSRALVAMSEKRATIRGSFRLLYYAPFLPAKTGIWVESHPNPIGGGGLVNREAY